MKICSFFCSSLSVAVVLCAAACGSDSSSNPIDKINPDGTHHQYVASSIILPATNQQAVQYSRDFDGDEANDNVVGAVLAAVSSASMINFQAPLDIEVAEGSLILLANVQATDLTNATGVGLWTFFGTNPNPEPCLDMDCGRHLGGDASFDIASDSPTDSVLVGQIAGGALSVGPGDIEIQLPLGLDTVVTVDVNLFDAMLTANISGSTITDGVLSGLLTYDEVNDELLPAVHMLMEELVTQDCTLTPVDPMEPGDCCEDTGSSGAQIIDFFQPENAFDCTLTLDEFRASPIVSGTLLTPDIDSTGDGEPDAISVGIGVNTVGATFDLPSSITGS